MPGGWDLRFAPVVEPARIDRCNVRAAMTAHFAEIRVPIRTVKRVSTVVVD